MVARGPGGTIPPQGRPPTNPGVGKNARRHDLERPKTPGLHNSDLQQGDVSMLERGQRVAPLPKKQNPVARPSSGATTTPQRGLPGGQGGLAVPDPIEFAKQRFGGTLGEGASSFSQVDVGPWIPLFRRLANAPSSSGTLRSAFVAHLSNMIRQPLVPESTVVDLDQVDRDLTDFANEL